MTDQPQPDRQDGDGLEYALGALRTIAASAHDTSAKQMAAIAQAGIDLATQGPIESGSERGDGPARDAAEGAGELVMPDRGPDWVPDNPAIANIFSDEALRASLTEWARQMSPRIQRMVNDLLTRSAAPPKPAPDAMLVLRGARHHIDAVLKCGNAHKLALAVQGRALLKDIDAALSAPVPDAMRGALAIVDKIRGGTRDGWGYGREECANFILSLSAPVTPASAMRTALEVAKVGFQNIIPESLTDADICKVAIAKIDWALSQAPVPPADGAMNDALAAHYGIPDELWKGASKDNPMVPSGTGAAEPVAWRWRWPYSDDPFLWSYNDKPPPVCDPASVIIEPLYATPPVRGDQETDDELAEQIHRVAGCHAKSERTQKLIAWYRAKQALPVQPGAGEREAAIRECIVAAGVCPAQVTPGTMRSAIIETLKALSRQAPHSGDGGGR